MNTIEQIEHRLDELHDLVKNIYPQKIYWEGSGGEVHVKYDSEIFNKIRLKIFDIELMFRSLKKEVTWWDRVKRIFNKKGD